MSRSRVTKLAFAIVLVCFVLSTFVSLWSLGVMARDNMRELSRVLAARIYDTISGELSDPITVARTMAADSFLVDALSREETLDEAEAARLLSTYLSGIKNGLDYEAAFVVSATTGRYYAYNGISKVIDPQSDSRDRWYAAFLEEDKPYDLDVDRDEVSGDAWTVFVDARVEDETGALLGVCGVGMQMSGSRSLFNQLEREYNVRVDLVNPGGLIQVDTDESRIETTLLTGIPLKQDEDYAFYRLGSYHFAVTKYVDRLGWYLVVQSDGRSAIAEFIHVLLLNVGLCALVMVILVITIHIIAERTRALTDASFRDQNTMLLNRRAFEEEKARRAMSTLPVDFVYVTADVNGLKHVNDILGHSAGDELIRGAATCLTEAFGRYGNIYRIGGDEFAAMLRLSGDELARAVAGFEQRVSRWKGERVDSLSVSCGYVASREFPSENIGELSRISDERMYEAKAAYYRETGAPRRT